LLVSFFVHSGAERGHTGIGAVNALVFAVSGNSLANWRRHLDAHEVAIVGRAWSFGEEQLCFEDPDGLKLALVENDDESTGAEQNKIPAVRRIRAIEMQLESFEHSVGFLEKCFGFERQQRDGRAIRLHGGSKDCPMIVDLLCTPDRRLGTPGPGVLNHVAWQVADTAALQRACKAVAEAGCEITPPLDRRYYQDAAFREPGGVSFSLATRGPGFLVDETINNLGRLLMLPPWLEVKRQSIVQHFASVSRGADQQGSARWCGGIGHS
jgi:glyoxalase family protein